MVDPAGGVGKAAGRLLQEVQHNARELRAGATGPAGGSGQSFQSTLEATRRGHAAIGPGAAPGAAPSAPAAVQGATAAARAVLARARITAGTAAPVAESAAAQRSRMAQMVDQLLGSQDKMTEIIKLALSGRQFSSQELLAMQAGVYRFAQELDLTGKVIEKATSGIKQTMNTQV